MWPVYFSNESIRTLNSFDMASRKKIMAGILQASQNPLPLPEGCGQSLSEKDDPSPAAFFKIDLKAASASIVYSLTLEPPAMNILFIIKT